MYNSQQVSLAPSVLTQDLVGESVLLNLESEEYFSQNEVATRMLSVLSASASIDAAYDILLEEYDVEAEELRKDLLNFIDKLVDAGLVEVTAL